MEGTGLFPKVILYYWTEKRENLRKKFNEYCVSVGRSVHHHLHHYNHHHHSVVCLTTGPCSLPQQVLQRVRSSDSPFSFLNPLACLRSSCRCVHLLPRLFIIFILPSTFPSITCFRKQFLCNMWPIQLAFLLFNFCRIFLSSLTPGNTSSFLTR